MSNSVTKKSPLKIRLGGSFSGYYATPVLINYDTTGSDLQISKSSGQSVFLVGLEGVKGSAYNLIFKSNSTQLVKYELAANSARVESFCPSNPRIICNSEPGEALNLNCDTTLPPLLAYIVEV